MRRVITGVDAEGRSFVQSDEQIADTGLIWVADPKEFVPLIEAIDPDSVLKMVQPPPGGVVWVLATLAPGHGMTPGLRPDRPEMDERGFHVTRSIDFAFLLDSGLILDLDRDSVELDAGDVVVLQAPRHAWRNPTDRPARFIDVVVSRVKD